MNDIAFYGRAGRDWQGSFLPWALVNGPILQAGGIDRLLWHNPGGIYQLPERGDERVMWPDQWAIAAAQGRPFADRQNLAAHHELLHEQHGLRETIYYIGEPQWLADPLADGLRCCEPFLLPGASLAFDHSARRGDHPRWKRERFRQLVIELRSRGHGVYVEARCDPADPDLAGLISGTIALARYDALEARGIVVAEHLQFGEFIRITGSAQEERDGQVATWEPEVTPALRNWGRIRTE